MMYDFYALKFKIFFKTLRLIIVPEYPGFKRVFLIKDFYYAVKYFNMSQQIFVIKTDKIGLTDTKSG